MYGRSCSRLQHTSRTWTCTLAWGKGAKRCWRKLKAERYGPFLWLVDALPGFTDCSLWYCPSCVMPAVNVMTRVCVCVDDARRRALPRTTTVATPAPRPLKRESIQLRCVAHEQPRNESRNVYSVIPNISIGAGPKSSAMRSHIDRVLGMMSHTRTTTQRGARKQSHPSIPRLPTTRARPL